MWHWGNDSCVMLTNSVDQCSIRAPGGRNTLLDCLENDQQIQADGPVLQVVDVRFHSLLDVGFLVYLAPVAVDLRPTGQPGSDEFTDQVFSYHPRKQLVVLRHMWSRAHHA